MFIVNRLFGILVRFEGRHFGSALSILDRCLSFSNRYLIMFLFVDILIASQQRFLLC